MSDVRVLVDFPALPRRAFSKPGAVLFTRELADVPELIGAAERAAKDGKWVIGFVCYEAAPAFDSALQVRKPGALPLAWFAVFDDAQPVTATTQERAAAQTWQLSITEAQFTAAIGFIREAIASGRTYQVNLTAQLVSEYDGDPVALYDSLRAAQGAGYHACIIADEFAVVSASPELFFETRDSRIRTRPMKGTRARGRFMAEDRRILRELTSSEKDRAENLMIVDLLRNDLGRIAQFESVQVTSLYDVESYRTVHQLTSTIEATLRDGVALRDVFAALFPCGSVTGAPKISTMRMIAELETEPRGVYCGALGIIAPGGDATFNVPIRTVVVDRNTQRAAYGTGAGITFDSDPAAEFAEIAAKAAVLTEAWPRFELLETMRVASSGIVRLDRHVARLLESARYFGFAVDEQRIRAALAAVRADEPSRLRLLVDEAGTVRTEVHALAVIEQLSAAIAHAPVQSTDRFLFHKTTHRAVYESRMLEGYDEVLLWNERREITEFTRGNVVVEMDGQLLTPARECGLLAGTFRAQLLTERTLQERVIGLDELRFADRIWLINSLREWVSVSLTEARV